VRDVETSPRPAAYVYPKRCAMRGNTSAPNNPNKAIAIKIDAMINASRLNMGGRRRW